MAEFAIEMTGLRQANVLGLTWSRVSLERKVIWVQAADMKANEALAVPLSEGALRVLKAVQGQHDEFCFTFRGKPIAEIKTAFQAACIRAGILGFTWHGFRHTWATWHIQNGTPLEVLQKLGGWSDPRMCQLYAHHSPGHLAGYADNATRTSYDKNYDIVSGSNVLEDASKKDSRADPTNKIALSPEGEQGK